ncbi:MAG: putative DNA binding domain-containing protein [Akkermansia sp.]|nr:putative DNA binding domain-containing protein [Akkermansia sp.]
MLEEDIRAGESINLEFKRELPARDKKVIKTFVAFANGFGGKVIFGIDNSTKEVVGVPDEERARLQDAVTDMISDTCSPQILPSFSWQTVQEKSLFIVEIPSSPQCPYYIKSEGLEKGVYVRVGATTRRAEPGMVRELQLKGQNKTYDAVVEHAVSAATQEEIEKLCCEIREYMGNVGKPVGLPQLLGWDLLQKSGRKYLPTNAFRLLTGESIHFSGIQCAVFHGTERVNFLDRKEFYGPVYEQLENAQRFLMQYLRRAAVIEGIHREDIYEIPLAALRETIANAILHRNYMVNAYIQISVFDDRVEIMSPGGLFANLSREEMFSGLSRLRNPILASVFHRMGIVEQWGTGIRRVMTACEMAKLPPPAYELTGDAVRVTIQRPAAVAARKKAARKRRPHKRDDALLAYLKEHPEAPLQQVADAFFISVATVWRFVQDMKAEGKL